MHYDSAAGIVAGPAADAVLGSITVAIRAGKKKARTGPALFRYAASMNRS
jgi:hypothetical protein